MEVKRRVEALCADLKLNKAESRRSEELASRGHTGQSKAFEGILTPDVRPILQQSPEKVDG